MDILYKPLTSPYCIFSCGIPIFCWLNPDSCHLNLQLHSFTPNVCWLTFIFFWWFLLKWSTISNLWPLKYGNDSFNPLDSSVPRRMQEKLIRRRTKPFGSAMQQRTDGVRFFLLHRWFVLKQLELEIYYSTNKSRDRMGYQ